jgi:hypothetical protein
VLAPVWEKVSHFNPREIFRGVFHEHAASLTRPEDYKIIRYISKLKPNEGDA